MARILIVEDDLFFAEVLASALDLDGHEVAVANGAGEGIWRGLANQPEVVIAAWRLKGGMHGGEVCRRIHAAWPSVKAIVITALQECVFEASQYCQCVETVIVKPFHKSEILEAVRRALGGETRFPATHLPVPHFQNNAIQVMTLGR